MLIMKEAVNAWRRGSMETLYFPINSAGFLKLLYTINSINDKLKPQELGWLFSLNAKELSL